MNNYTEVHDSIRICLGRAVIGLCVSAAFWSAPLSARAQSNTTDSLTISTYFPAPYGTYSVLQLSPQPAAPASPNQGDMYYHSGSEMAYIWTGSGWLPWAGKQALGECDIKISGSSSQGVTMNAITYGCSLFCDGKGYQYKDVYCADRREVRDSDGEITAYTWYDFHACKRSGYETGDKSELGQFYCYAHDQTTKVFCFCQK